MFFQSVYTAATGIYYSWKVWWEFGLFYMLAPYLYFLLVKNVQPLIGTVRNPSLARNLLLVLAAGRRRWWWWRCWC